MDDRLLSAEQLKDVLNYVQVMIDGYEYDLLTGHIDAQAAQIARLEAQLAAADALADAVVNYSTVYFEKYARDYWQRVEQAGTTYRAARQQTTPDPDDLTRKDDA